MIGDRRLFCGLLFTIICEFAIGQNNTNSPYTRYGYGQLSDQSFGNSKAMGSIAYGLRNGSQINTSNPASYTAIDSLTFILEGGFTLQNTNFSDGTIKTNAANSSLDYLAMQFRLNRRLAMSIGMLPFSNVGYGFSSQETVIDNTSSDNPLPSEIIATNTFAGNGGLHQLYVGLGFKILNNLSIGTNVSYLFGNINHTLVTSFSGLNVHYNQRQTSIRIHDYKLDFGLQYTKNFRKKHAINLGAVYSLKHQLNTDAYRYDRTTSIDSNGGSTIIKENIDTLKGFSLPHSFGIGFTYVYDKRLTVGFDYTLQKWGETEFENSTNFFSDRSKYAVGVEFQPKLATRHYLGRIKYRAGAYYSNPYIKVKEGASGAREYGISVGFGLPIFNSKSLLNISAQYIKVTPKTKELLTEQYMKLSIGLTFNERWFAKWKVE